MCIPHNGCSMCIEYSTQCVSKICTHTYVCIQGELLSLPLTPTYVVTSNENNGLVCIAKWWKWLNIKEVCNFFCTHESAFSCLFTTHKT